MSHERDRELLLTFCETLDMRGIAALEVLYTHKASEARSALVVVIDAFLASREPAPPATPPEYIRFFPCPFCGEEISHPDDKDKPLPPAPPATRLRY